MLEKAKKALRITITDFDDEIQALIETAMLDLGIAGVKFADPKNLDRVEERAVLTYVAAHFGNAPKEEAERLEKWYIEQKKQLSMSTGHTEWGDTD